MSKYYCYRKHPEVFVRRTPQSTVYASYPAWREYMDYEEWVKQGSPLDDSINFRRTGKGKWRRK